MKIYGYLRFSFLGLSDTKMSAQLGTEYDAYFGTLYDPVRMARRFHLFEHLCMPGLRQQRDPDFTVIILVSSVMPQVYKDRLEDAVSDCPQIQISYSEQQHVLQALRPHMKRNVDASAGNSLHFRLDDDDVLGTDAIADLKQMGARAEPGTVLTLPTGFNLFAHDGRPYLLPHYHRFHPVGWTRVNGPGDYRSPYKFSHVSAGKRFPSMIDPRPVGFAYTMHAESDTKDRNSGLMRRFLKEAPKPANFADQKHLEETVQHAFPGIGLAGLCEAILTVPQTQTTKMAAE